jgi:hypothetical protein
LIPLNSNSGIGDFRVNGIEAFLKDHQCKVICGHLGLKTSMPLTLVDLDTLGGTSEDSENHANSLVGKESSGSDGNLDSESDHHDGAAHSTNAAEKSTE